MCTIYFSHSRLKIPPTVDIVLVTVNIDRWLLHYVWCCHLYPLSQIQGCIKRMDRRSWSHIFINSMQITHDISTTINIHKYTCIELNYPGWPAKKKSSKDHVTRIQLADAKLALPLFFYSQVKQHQFSKIIMHAKFPKDAK